MVSRRCTECRKTFKPARSAQGTQRVCGDVCRAVRARRLARARRCKAVDDARVDERMRQRASRESRAARDCHAGPSTRTCLLSPREVRAIVDRTLDRSRATLERDLSSVLRLWARNAGSEGAGGGGVSRGGLELQATNNKDDSGAALASMSRMSLGVPDSP